MQWLRYIKIELDEGDGNVETLDINSLRVRFKISQMSMETPNSAEIVITNFRKETAIKIIKDRSMDKMVKIWLGYINGAQAMVFQGNLVQARYDRESPTDTIFTLHAHDGFSGHNFAFVNKTLKGGSTGMDVYNALLDTMKPFGINKGFATSALQNINYERAVTLFGNTNLYARSLALSAKSTWTIHNGKYHVIGIKEPLPGTAVVLNPDTGLIGSPEQNRNGINFRVLINPEIAVAQIVKCDESFISEAGYDYGPFGNYNVFGDPVGSNLNLPKINADGLYKVIRIDWFGDTWGTPWYMDLECLDITASGAPKGSDLEPYITYGS